MIAKRLAYRKRMYTEVKAKIVAAAWGTELLHQDNLKNRMNSPFSSYDPGAIHPFLHIILVKNTAEAQQGLKQFCPPSKAAKPFVPSLLYKSFFYGLARETRPSRQESEFQSGNS